jgi:DNA-binding transcriptional MerR regulator
MRIGELARRAAVNVETLRYYERRGLLEEPPRGPNGHREYDEETVRFVKAVKEAQSLGFTLSEIEEHTRLTRSGGGQESIRIRLAQKIDELDAKLASLQRVRDELARVLGCACDSLDHCTCGAAYLARGGRDPQVGRLLQVTNGESAGNTLRQTSLGGAVLSCQVVLWFEHDLYDQLQLLQVLAGAQGDVELIQAADHLGPLGPDELEALWSTREPVTAEMLALAREAWDAFRAPEPSAVAELLARDTAALPFLGPAFVGCSRSRPMPRAASPAPSASCSSRCSTGRAHRPGCSSRARRAKRRRSPATPGSGSGWPSSSRSSRSCHLRRRSATPTPSSPHPSRSPTSGARSSPARPTAWRWRPSTAGSAGHT